jgi:uncharacterized protein
MAGPFGQHSSMPDSGSRKPAFCVVLHDVAPSTWTLYAEFIRALDQLGRVPLTLLVVPDFHRQGTIDRFPAFIKAIEQHLARGDEVVLHGYYHDDPGPLGWSSKEWFMRRLYTHEAEFYRLAEPEALCRLKRGIDLFARLGWPVSGFVPPAWLLGNEGRQALVQCGFAYTSDIGHLIRLPDLRPEPALTLVWSARSVWRRGLSRVWNDLLLAQQHQAPLIRLGLHPVDLRHHAVYRYWLATVRHLLDMRTPMTKSAWLNQGP